MVVETGGEDREEEKTSGVIRDAVEAILAVPERKRARCFLLGAGGGAGGCAGSVSFRSGKDYR